MAATKTVRVTNIAPQATRDQMHTLFSFIGKIEDIRLYPTVRDVAVPVATRVSFIRFVDPIHSDVAQHMSNTVYIDRALVVTPYHGDFPEEGPAMEALRQDNGLIGTLNDKELPSHVSNVVEGAYYITKDPNFPLLGIPEYPTLSCTLEYGQVEEIRRTVVVGNLPPKMDADQVVELVSEAGEVKYARMCGRESDLSRACLIEFSEQASVVRAMLMAGTEFLGQPIHMAHSSLPIVKPQIKTNEMAQREIEEAMRRTQEQQKLISSTLKPQTSYMDTKRRSRSRSHHRHSSSHRKHSSYRRSRSRDRKRSRSKGRKRSRSKDRKRSRSKDRKRSRSKDRKRSKSRDRKRSRSKDQNRDRRHKSRSKDRDKKSSRDRRAGSREKASGADKSRDKADRGDDKSYASQEPHSKSKESADDKTGGTAVDGQSGAERVKSRSPAKARSRSRTPAKKRSRSKTPPVKKRSRSRSGGRKRSRSPGSRRSRRSPGGRRRSGSRSRRPASPPRVRRRSPVAAPRRRSRSPRPSRSRRSDDRDRRPDRSRERKRDRADSRERKDGRADSRERKDGRANSRERKDGRADSRERKDGRSSTKVSRDYDEEEKGYDARGRDSSEGGSPPPAPPPPKIKLTRSERHDKKEEDMDISD